MERFGLATDEEAEGFLRERLLAAQVFRAGRALKWVHEDLTIVTSPFKGDELTVVTIYQAPKSHGHTKEWWYEHVTRRRLERVLWRAHRQRKGYDEHSG
jgi:hypothetical protein